MKGFTFSPQVILLLVLLCVGHVSSLGQHPGSAHAPIKREGVEHETISLKKKHNSNGNGNNLGRDAATAQEHKKKDNSAEGLELEEADTEQRSSTPFHAARSGGEGSGAVLTHHKTVAGEKPKAEGREGGEAGDREQSAKGVGSSQTKGERKGNGGFGRDNATERNIHLGKRNNEDGGDDDGRKRRGLKARGGVGNLKVKPNAIKARTAGARQGASPIDCKERQGKKCKQAPVDQRAGEQRGPHLTIEGTEEKIPEPDLSLAEATAAEMQQELSSSTLDWVENVGGTVDDASKRFYGYPSTSTATNVEAENAASLLVQVDANGNMVDEETMDISKEAIDEGKAKTEAKEEAYAIPEFEHRTIPNRYGSNQQATVFASRNSQEGQQQQSEGGETNQATSTTGPQGEATVGSETSGTATDQPEWVANYYKEQASFYSGNSGGTSESATAGDGTTTTTGTPPPSEAAVSSGGDAGSTNENGGDDTQAPDSVAAAYQYYEKWFEDVDGATDTDAASDGDGSSGTFFSPGESYTGDGSGTNAPAYYSFFDDDDDDEDDDDDDDEEDGEDTPQGQNSTNTTSGTANSGPYLSFFGSTTLHPMHNTSTTAFDTTQSNGDAQDNGATLKGSETDATTQPETTSSIRSEVENGVTYYTESVVASPVYVETMGSSDLQAHKQEVFDSLEPLLSRHLEMLFGEHFIENYQLTVTYVQSDDSILQLRRGSEAKTYITQLVVLCVFHLRTTEKDDIVVFTDTVATEAVQQFFDETNDELKTFLRILSSKGVHTRQVHAQGQPHPPRNHAFEHGISHITPSDATVPPNFRGESDEKAWSFFSLFNDQGTKTAVIASFICGFFIVLAIIGAVCYNRQRRQKLVGRSRAILDNASDLASEVGSRAQVSMESLKSKIRNSRQRGYLNLNFGSKRGSGASVRSNASSKLSYIQPAAIQLRRKRGIAVPQDDTPLPGRQDDDFALDDNKKPSSIYDIDIDNDADLRGTRRVEKVSITDEDDYDSESSDSSGSSDDDTMASRASRLSMDRISIARSKKAVEKRESIQEEFEDEDEDDDEVERGHYGRQKGSFSGSQSGIYTNGSGRASTYSDRSRGAGSYAYETASTPHTPSPPYVSSQASRSTTYRRDPDDYAMTQKSFAPLSPLSSLLAEAMNDSPKPLTHTASRPQTQTSERSRRRGMDPPPTHSFTPDYLQYGAEMTPPTSMQDIMPDEYLNKQRWQDAQDADEYLNLNTQRWQDAEDDTTVNLPDHVSSSATTHYSPNSNGDSTYTSGTTTDRQLVVHDNEKQRRKQYRY